MRAHGVRGELRVAPETDFPDRLVELREAYLLRGDRATPVRLEAVRRTADALLVKIAGIDAPEEARRWRGARLAVPRTDAAALPAGRYFVFEVIGMSVETEQGETLGRVDEVIRTPANDVFVARGPRGEVLIPTIATVVLSVDTAARRIVIRPLAGMLEDARTRTTA